MKCSVAGSKTTRKAVVVARRETRPSDDPGASPAWREDGTGDGQPLTVMSRMFNVRQ
jgi:hypothetical protein